MTIVQMLLATPRRRRAVIAVIILGTLFALHAPLLRGVGRFLIVDQSAEQADYVVLLPSTVDDRTCVDEAARLIAERRVRGVLLFESPATRAVRSAGFHDQQTIVRGELAAKGVPAGAVEVLPGPGHNAWGAADSLDRWLRGHPDARLVVPCERFRGRCEQRIMATVLPPTDAAQLSFAAVPGSAVDEANWWQSREGIQIVFQNYIRLAAIACNGRPPDCAGTWTVEEFEESLPKATDP